MNLKRHSSTNLTNNKPSPISTLVNPEMKIVNCFEIILT